MILTFNKISGKWYVDLPEWEGDFEDLEMVAGADDMLEALSWRLNRQSITFAIRLSKPDYPCGHMKKIEQSYEGATYDVLNCMYYTGTAWLCNVTKFVFGGYHPNDIYFRVVLDDMPFDDEDDESVCAETTNDSSFDLNRFLTAQENVYPIALEEMQKGRKRGHWIWFIFPQQKGLGHSYNSEYYGLDGLDEAKAYVQHPVLGHRLREICQALLRNKGKDIHYIMGSDIDVIKLKTSMKLFDLASPNDIFAEVLCAFF